MVSLPIPFVGEAYTARSKSLDSQSCINFYLEKGHNDSKSPLALYGTPGTLLFANAGSSRGRGLWYTSTERLFVVVSNQLKEVLVNGSVVFRATINTSIGFCDMTDNGYQLAIVDGLNGYIYDMNTETFTQIASPNFPNGTTSISCIDGYFLSLKDIADGLFAISLQNNGLTWNGLDFSSAEGSPDKLIRGIASNRRYWAFGSKSTEVFWDTGGDENFVFPFERIEGSFSDIGCLSADSVATLRDLVFWLGASRDGSAAVWMGEGYRPTKVSNPAIEFDLDKWTDAIGWSYEKEGHAFYVVSSNINKRTWAFDITTNTWHQRMYRDPISAERQQHHIVKHVYAFNKNLVISSMSGKIYELSNDVFTDDGATIVRERACQHMSKNGDRVIFSSLWVDAEVGVGSGNGADSEPAKNPHLILDWSDDGGYSFGNELWRELGKVGERKQRILFSRLGVSRDRVFRIKTSAPVKVVILGAAAELAGEDNG